MKRTGLFLLSLFVMLTSCSKTVERPFVRNIVSGKSSSRITEIKTEDSFDLRTRVETIKNPKAGVSRKSPITGHSLPYAKTNKYTSRELEESMKYGAMDIYENERESVGFLYGSDQLAFYFNEENMFLQREHVIDSEELINNAKTFLSSYFPVEWLNEMTSRVEESNSFEGYYVIFQRYAYSYLLSEGIIITLNGRGEVVGFNGSKFGILRTFKDDYSIDEIESAKQAILDKITACSAEIVSVSEPMIEANAAGHVFLTLSVETKETSDEGKEYTVWDSITTPIRFPVETD